MSNFYPVTYPIEENWNGRTVTVGDSSIGHFTFDETERIATTDGYVYPPEDPDRLQAIAREAGCVIRIAGNVLVDLDGGLGRVRATPVTVVTDSSGAHLAEEVPLYPLTRNAAQIRRHARGVKRFADLVVFRTTR